MNPKQDSPEQVKALQLKLQKQGLYKGKIDGVYGSSTEAAYKKALQAPAKENIQYVGGRGFDSNTVRQGDFGELIAKDIRTNEDFGVVRKPDGKYDFYQEKSIPLKEVSVVDKYNIPPAIKQQLRIALQNGQQKNFTIIDKSDNHAYYFDPSGKTLGVETVITGKSKNDRDKGLSMKEFFKQNNTTDHEAYFKYLEDNNYQTTPTGHYTIGAQRENVTENPDKVGDFINSVFRPERKSQIEANRIRDYGRQGKLMTLIDDNGVPSSKAIHGTANPNREAALADPFADRAMSNGCININGESICFNTLDKGSQVYITNGLTTVDKQIEKAPKEFTKTKKKVARQLDASGIPYDDEKLNFIATVSEKESEGGRGRFAQIENAVPYFSKSTGSFQINPETFKDYLPENYSGSYADQVKAVSNFHDNTTGTAEQKYSQYNGATIESAPVQLFKTKYEQMKKSYVSGGDIGNALTTIAPLASFIPGWGTIAGIGLGTAGGILQNQQDQKEMRPSLPGYRYPGYANGGEIDTQLSDGAFQVKGAPNQTDGNYYPGKDVYLDHNEVVKNNFVFSTDLINPYTKKPFSETAARIESSTGKVEKKMNYKNDFISKNTAKMNDQMLSGLASVQENFAKSMGLRNDSRHLANGGPFDPKPGQQYMEIGKGTKGMSKNKTYYYDPYNNRVVTRFPDGSYAPVREGAAGDYTMPSPETISQHVQRYSGTSAQAMNVPNDMAVTDKFPSMRTEGVQIPGIEQQPFTGYDPFGGFPVDLPRPVSAPQPVAPVGKKPLGSRGYKVPATQTISAADNVALDYSRFKPVGENFDMIPSMRTPKVPFDNRDQPVYSNAAPTVPNISGSRVKNTAPVKVGSSNDRSKYTTGDALQAIELGSKFIDAFGKPQKEPRYMDSTQLTRPSYDPRQALQVNDANYQNAVNSISSSSPTLRRSLANNMYASKLNADSGVLGKYQEMNTQANVGFEDRVSNRNRYNIAQGVQTNDLNARNRGAQDQVQQNAFESLGNFGQMLNQKKYGYDSLKILKEMYPDVYDRIINAYNGQ